MLDVALDDELVERLARRDHPRVRLRHFLDREAVRFQGLARALLSVGSGGADGPRIGLVGVGHEVVEGERGDHRRLPVLLRNAEEAPAVAEVTLRVAGVELVDPVLLPGHEPERPYDVLAGRHDAVPLDPGGHVGAVGVAAAGHVPNLPATGLVGAPV